MMGRREMARRTGLHERTIRRYVSQGLLRPVEAKVNGHWGWGYSEGDVTRALTIAAHNFERLAARSPRLYDFFVRRAKRRGKALPLLRAR